MSLKFNVLIVVQFQRYCQQEAIENLDKSVLTFGSIKIAFNWNGFVSLSWHIFMLSKIASNGGSSFGTFLKAIFGNCVMFPQIVPN